AAGQSPRPDPPADQRSGVDGTPGLPGRTHPRLHVRAHGRRDVRRASLSGDPRMTRLTWRLARPNILASVLLLAAVAVYAALTRREMSGYLDDSGLAACISSGGDCQNLARDFSDKFSVVINSYRWITLVPLIVGMFW